jgi:hypothetical protein
MRCEVEMSKRREEEQQGQADGAEIAQRSALESGVLPKGMLDELDKPPPWEIVQAYLTRGEHREWVEGYAARAPAFRDVIEALRNDEDDRRDKQRRRVVVPLKR